MGGSSSTSSTSSSGVPPLVSSCSASTSSSAPPLVGSSSSRSSSVINWRYEVFLSFRGADIRKTFVDHLYEALDQRGIYTFKDDRRLREGESISHELLKAIEQSRTAIVIFSENYASSGWCLEELQKIMECKDKLQLIYPVFYDVEPSQVRKQTGIFGEGFAKAVKRKAGKADVWKKALEDAAGLSGLDVRNTAGGHQAQCIKQIVERFMSNDIILSFDENLIGIKPRVRKLLSLLGRDIDNVQMIGIRGMGGSGKTTMARVAFDDVSKKFDGVSFIENVREFSKRSGLQFLQEKILSNILREQKMKVDRVSVGIEMIRRRLGSKKVLIVLDDVDDIEQLRALAGEHSWFGKGSRILITTRDEHLLVAHAVDEIHSVHLLTDYEAIQLFNRYAFKKCIPTKEYDELSQSVVRYAGGLPLALKVLGSFLCGRSATEWTSALERLKKVPEKDILEILKISFDGLKDIEKELFLDITCFFKGWSKDEVVKILDSCGFDPGIGINILVEKSLIMFSEDQRVQMHDLIQEMGREIVKQMHPEEPGKHSRLWRPEDICYVLAENMGTEAIKAIVIHGFNKNPVVEWAANSFRSMKKLRILYFSESRFLQESTLSCVRPEYLPNELRWLTWDSYTHESLPESFLPPKLVQLRMHNSRIVRLWKEKKLLDKLKFLDLSHSQTLIRCPDFSGFPNLKLLILENCSRLIDVHPSIGYLQRLVLLNLRYCSNLMDLPDTICALKGLITMDLYGCRRLMKLPENLGGIESLEELKLDCSGVTQPPSSILLLKNLKHVSFSQCKIPEDSMGRLLQPLVQLSYLKVLNLSGCGLSDGAIPVNIGNLSSLEELDLRWNNFSFLPSSISQLSRLKILTLYKCTELKSLPELPSSIAILRAFECTSLQCIELGVSGKYEWLWYVKLQGCSSLRMHERCDLCMLDNSFTGPTNKSDFCGKHQKKLQEQSVGDILLPLMLQGNVIVNHRFSILYTPKDPPMNTLSLPMWFGQQVKGDQLVLDLPPNWENKIAGFAMCICCGTNGMIPMNLSPVIQLHISLSEPRSSWGSQKCTKRNVWMGYISLNMLRCLSGGVVGADWFDSAATQLFLTFEPTFSVVEFCAARLVYLKEEHGVELEVTAVSSSTTGDGSLVQQEDPNFGTKINVPCHKYNETGYNGNYGVSLLLDTH